MKISNLEIVILALITLTCSGISYMQDSWMNIWTGFATFAGAMTVLAPILNWFFKKG